MLVSYGATYARLARMFWLRPKAALGDALMAEGQDERPRRSCGWCAERVVEDAVVCPHCRRWRKDVYQDRMWYYLWTAAAALAGGVLAFGFGMRWWHEKVGPDEMRFSTELFLQSRHGVASLVGFVICLLLVTVYWVKVSLKTRVWIWL